LDELPPAPRGKTGWPWTEDTPRLPDTQPYGRPWPRVSVVTPSYNQGYFLEETIRSVLLQGYPDLEYIILDGGSTDASPDVIRTYEPWLAYWVSEPDRGQTQAINTGWSRATGEIFAYINADDCYLPGAISTVAQEFTAAPVGMVYGTALIVNEEGRAVRDWEAEPFDVGIMLAKGNIVPQPASFFSKDAVSTVGPLNEDWKLIMDYDFSIRVGMRFPSACVDRTLATFRAHPDAKTRLQFESTARELILFIENLDIGQAKSRKTKRIKRAALGRVYYELAWGHLGYLSGNHRDGMIALKPLAKSIALHPQFAASRPRLTARIMKELLVDCPAEWFARGLGKRARS
jgi:glycosyltransferase involved in cell wall biosynthesis